LYTMSMVTIESWLAEASDLLKKAGIGSARLDAELILAHTIRKNRTYLHAHTDETLSERHLLIADARLRMRLERIPVAYIIGHKDFYGRLFKTTPAALIPRPESEAIIELLQKIHPVGKKHLVDIGTGTGCLGITAKLEYPELDVTLVDISQHALNLARENAERLGAKVHLHKGDLLRGWIEPIDIIIANLPYVDKKWDVSPETYHEPSLALYADDNGMSLIEQLTLQASRLLPSKGYLVLESDQRQHATLIQFAKQHSFIHLETNGLANLFARN